jgi:protein-L-isoaspartate(D-aspartate) O-methyltransferase
MVENQLAARGITDPAVLAAMREIPREKFVPHALVERAYQDSPLTIPEEQTISQPYIVALMAAALRLRPGDRVLEVGTGSGYAAAVLARIVGHVFTIERHAALVDLARRQLADAGVTGVELRCGDGTLGWPEHAPFDAIVVAAGAPRVPPALLAQLALGGRLVMPVGPEDAQQLLRFTRTGPDTLRREDLGPVRFVPLVGGGQQVLRG